MYERFTDRARKVMQLANQEAQRLNHEYIGTEHILLGLVKEGSGVAANVLKNLNINLHKIRSEIESITQSGPEMAWKGRRPQTPRAKKVIEYAIEEARNLNHNYVGTEHLLLGLLRDEETAACQVLMYLGLTLANVRKQTLNLLGENSTPIRSRVCSKIPSGGLARRLGLKTRQLGLKIREHQILTIFTCGLLATIAAAWMSAGYLDSTEANLGALIGGVIFVTAVALASWTART
jgi:ATP-dependent Clp protease ATP-binding subunit ClpC